MIQFTGGPAGGQTLALGRAPVLLRVVVGPRGKLDALDQLDDEPREDERIHVYRLASSVTVMRVSRRPRSQSGWFVVAKYRLLEPQPLDMQVRERAAWNEWCDSVREAVLSAIAAEEIERGKVI